MFKKTDILFYKEASSLTFVISIGISLIVIAVKFTAFAGLIFASPNFLASLTLVFLYLLPPILTTVLPIAVFASCALVSLRMSADSEINALFSSGMSVTQILIAPMLLGVFTLALLIGNEFYYEPYSRYQFNVFTRLEASKLVESFFDNNIKPKTFISDFPLKALASQQTNMKSNLVFYVDSISKNKTLSNIFISLEDDNSHTRNTVIAQKGRFANASQNGYPDFTFTLSDGVIYNEFRPIIEFSGLNLSLLNVIGNRFTTDPDSSNRPVSYSVKSPTAIAKAISEALCALFFPALGVCLGLFSTHNKPYRVYLGIGFISIAFYALLFLARNISTRYNFSPYLTFSVLPVIFCVLTFFLVFERQKIR